MAAIPPTRTRSLRANASNLTRPHYQQQGGNSTSTVTAATTVKQGTAAALEVTPGPSPLSLFLTNMRLLDLDQLPDWPDITTATFMAASSGIGAAQGLKKRIGCVEWALFRLFELYDAEETSKLKPLFPPGDQGQSVNLRAALLRGLEGAKKSGVLGKDTILRKTMLDDCKGERLEELLAAFSTAVLKIIVAAENGTAHASPTLRLALENRGYKDDKMDVTALGLVYKASLSKTLRQRKKTQTKYRDFEDLLDVKERGVRRRREEAKALRDAEQHQRGKVMSQDAMQDVRRTVKHNWAGHDQWMETLLYGDAGIAGKDDGLFGMPFDRIWRRVEQSRLAELEDNSVGLLEQLERRVRGHEERLARWEKIRAGLGGGRGDLVKAKQKSQQGKIDEKGLDLGFGAHESLQLGIDIGQKRDGTSSVTRHNGLGPQCDQFTKALERDLAAASARTVNPREALGFLFDRRPKSPGRDMLKAPAMSHEVVSEISDFEEDDSLDQEPQLEHTVKPTQVPKPQALKRLTIRPKLVHPSSRHSYEDPEDGDHGGNEVHKHQLSFRNAPKLSRPKGKASASDQPQDASRVLPARSKTTSSAQAKAYKEPRPASPLQQEQPDQPTNSREQCTSGDESLQREQQEAVSPELAPEEVAEPVSPTQDLADEILESIKNASPSPAKPGRPRHKLSLAERTRMSMARGSLLFAEDEEVDLLEQKKDSSTPPSNEAEDEGSTPTEDLAARTRRSMVGFEKARQKAQLDRRRSMRKSKAMGPPIKEGSYFPRVQEEEEGGSVLAEELMAEEDMEAVFKSRPRIAASPLPSPTREWEG